MNSLASALIVLAAMQTAAYWCPMHPHIRSSTPDKCPLCAMTLVPVPPPVYGHYRLDVTQVPRADRKGIRSLRLALRHPRTAEPVTALTETHERLLHLFIVGRDLEYFAHVHPEPSNNGFEVPVDLAPGAYVLIADFIPAGGAPQVLQRTIVTPGYTASPFTSVRLAEDLSDKIAGTVRISLAADARVGKASVLRFTVRDAATGEGVGDLEPYLGASGHLLIVSADVTEAFHAHPEGIHAIESTGPDVIFGPMFPAPGVYKLWVQFQRRGVVITAPFAIAVRE